MAVNIRYWTRLAMPKAIASGVSFDKLIGIIKAQYGKSYRRKTALQDWAEISGVPQKAERLKYVRKGYKPGPDLITETLGPQKQKYVYSFKVKGYDIIEGKDIETGMSVGTKFLLSMEEAEDAAMQNLDMYSPDIQIKSIERHKVTKAT